MVIVRRAGKNPTVEAAVSGAGGRRDLGRARSIAGRSEFPQHHGGAGHRLAPAHHMSEEGGLGRRRCGCAGRRRWRSRACRRRSRRDGRCWGQSQCRGCRQSSGRCRSCGRGCNRGQTDSVELHFLRALGAAVGESQRAVELAFRGRLERDRDRATAARGQAGGASVKEQAETGAADCDRGSRQIGIALVGECDAARRARHARVKLLEIDFLRCNLDGGMLCVGGRRIRTNPRVRGDNVQNRGEGNRDRRHHIQTVRRPRVDPLLTRCLNGLTPQ